MDSFFYYFPIPFFDVDDEKTKQIDIIPVLIHPNFPNTPPTPPPSPSVVHDVLKEEHVVCLEPHAQPVKRSPSYPRTTVSPKRRLRPFSNGFHIIGKLRPKIRSCNVPLAHHGSALMIQNQRFLRPSHVLAHSTVLV